MLLSVAVLVYGSGCGGESENVTLQEPNPAGTRTYSNSVADTAMLLRDASAAMKAFADAGLGVHFIYTSNTFGEEQLVIAQGEGDMVFPDRASVTSSVYLTEEPEVIDLIAIGETVYVRSEETGGVWRRDERGVIPPNPRNVWNYIDFARGSRNLGVTTMPDGRKAYQIQVDIDANLLSTESMKHYTDQRIIAMLEVARSSTVTAMVWIGVDDLLVYKQSISTTNPVTGNSSEQQLTYSNWGEAVEIVQPCVVC